MDKPCKRPVLLLASLAVLSGCALPLPLVIVGYAADGISLAASDKTLSDHALSAVADEDCALWRVVTDEDICIDDGRRHDIMVASADGPVVYGAPTQPAPAPAAESEPTLQAGVGPVAVLPASAPIGAIAAIVGSDNYADIRTAGDTPTLAAAAGAPAPRARPSIDAGGNPDFTTVSELDFDVPLPPARPEARLVAAGSLPIRSVSQVPAQLTDIPRPPSIPIRRGTVAAVPGSLADMPLPPPVPAERG